MEKEELNPNDLTKRELIMLCMKMHYIARSAMDLYTDLLEETKGIYSTPEYNDIESDAYEVRSILYSQHEYGSNDDFGKLYDKLSW